MTSNAMQSVTEVVARGAALLTTIVSSRLVSQQRYFLLFRSLGLNVLTPLRTFSTVMYTGFISLFLIPAVQQRNYHVHQLC